MKLKVRRKKKVLPKPYYETKFGQLYCGDCLDIMSSLTRVGLVVTSPPYNMGVGKKSENDKGFSPPTKIGELGGKYSYFSDDLPIEKYYEVHKKRLAKMMEISSTVFWNIQIVTGSKEAVFHLIGHFRKNLRDIIVWNKLYGEPAMSPSVINRSFELLLIFDKKKKGRKFKRSFFDRGTMEDIWTIKRSPEGIRGKHRAMFPEKLVAKIIKGWSTPTDTILDPFSGSGVTAIVCEKLGRKWIAVEMSRKACRLSKKLIRQEARRIKLF